MGVGGIERGHGVAQGLRCLVIVVAQGPDNGDHGGLGVVTVVGEGEEPGEEERLAGLKLLEQRGALLGGRAAKADPPPASSRPASSAGNANLCGPLEPV